MERNISVWLPLAQPPLGTRPAIQACALTGNQTCDPLVCRLALNPLSHTNQGYFLKDIFQIAVFNFDEVQFINVFPFWLVLFVS